MYSGLDPTKPLPDAPRGYSNWREVYREALPSLRAYFEKEGRPKPVIGFKARDRAELHDLAGLDVTTVALYAAREQAEEDEKVGTLGVNEWYALWQCVTASPDLGGAYKALAHKFVVPMFEIRRKEHMNKNR